MLKGTKISIHQDFDFKTRAVRRYLLKYMWEARRNGQHAIWSRIRFKLTAKFFILNFVIKILIMKKLTMVIAVDIHYLKSRINRREGRVCRHKEIPRLSSQLDIETTIGKRATTYGQHTQVREIMTRETEDPILSLGKKV